MHVWILTKLGRNHPRGQGFKVFHIYGTCGPDGGPGAPKGQNLKPCMQIQSEYSNTFLCGELKLFMAVPRLGGGASIVYLIDDIPLAAP